MDHLCMDHLRMYMILRGQFRHLDSTMMSLARIIKIEECILTSETSCMAFGAGHAHRWIAAYLYPTLLLLETR